MLAGKYPSRRRRRARRAHHAGTASTDTLTPMRGARMVADDLRRHDPRPRALHGQPPRPTRLGELDEEFVHESRVGDVFQLGSSTWRIRAIEHDRVIVVPAPGAPARMPFWHGEYMARSSHLDGARRRAAPRARRRAHATTISPRSQQRVRRRRADDALARRLRAGSSARSTRRRARRARLVLEHFRDEVGSVRMVLHAPFGGRVNAPWGMALAPSRCAKRPAASRFRCRRPTTASCSGCPTSSAAPPIDVFRAPRRRRSASGSSSRRWAQSSLFGARFRMNAARALLLPRGNAAAPHAALAPAAQGARPAPGGAASSRRSRFSSRPIATCCRTRSTWPRCATCSADIASGAIAIRVVAHRDSVAVRARRCSSAS